MVFQALQKVFRKPTYALIALITSAIMFAFAAWLPNIRLIASVVGSPDTSISQKLGIPISLLGSIATNFTFLSALYTIATALLIGVNIALLVYYAKRQRQLSRGGLTMGTAGILSGILGMGCAACGSLILTSLLGTAGGIGVIALLPLRGGEFGILGVVFLGIATYLLAKQISKPIIC